MSMTSESGSPAVRTATRVAEEVLFPAATMVDTADRVPESHFRVLADNGFHDLSTLDAPDYAALLRVVEILAGGCLTTTFVWLQHHGPLRTLAGTANAALRERHLADLAAGRRRAGTGVGAAIRPGPPLLRATPVDGGYRFDGRAPWVTGWDMIDLVQIAARDEHDLLVFGLLDAVAGTTLTVEELDLLAVRASRTVTLRFDGHFVPHDRVVHTTPQAEHLAGDAESQRFNGALALGVAGRAITLLGEDAGSLPAELDAARATLLAATPTGVPAARAAGSELALRATAAAAVRHGSATLLPGTHTQRLLREAAFLLLFGSRPPIRSALLDTLTGRAEP